MPGEGQNAPTHTVPIDQASLGGMKRALVGVGDGLPAAEVSTAGVKRRARETGFVKCNEFGQPVDPGYVPPIEEHEADDGIIELVPGEGGPGPAPIADAPPPGPPAIADRPQPHPVAPVAPIPAPAPMMETPHHAHEQVEEKLPIDLAMQPIGNVVFRANYMEIKIPIIDLEFDSPMLLLLTPPDADTKFEPPAKAEGVEIKIPPLPGMKPIPGLPVDEFLPVYVTGLYPFISKFAVQAAIFFIPGGDE